MKQKLIAIAILNLSITIFIMAMSSHFFEKKLDLKSFKIFEIALKFQGIASFVIVILAIATDYLNTIKPYTFLIALGFFIFCGTLYALALMPFFGIHNLRWLGAITPIGGLIIIVTLAWLGIKMYFKK